MSEFESHIRPKAGIFRNYHRFEYPIEGVDHPKIPKQILSALLKSKYGVVAQLGEHLPCKQDVEGSIPSDSTRIGNPRRNKDLFRSY